jgi:competence protein ComEC
MTTPETLRWRHVAARHDLRLVPAAATVWLATLLGIHNGWPWTVAIGLALAILAVITASRTNPHTAATNPTNDPINVTDSPTNLANPPTSPASSSTSPADSPTSPANSPIDAANSAIDPADPPASLADPPASLAGPPTTLADPPANVADPPTKLADPPANSASRPGAAVRVAALAMLVCGLVTAIWTGARLHHDSVNPLADLARRGESVRLRVGLTDLPKPITSAGFAGQPGGVRSVLIPAAAITVTADGRATPVDGDVLLIAPVKGWANLVRGQQADATGQLTVPQQGDTAVAVLLVRGAPHATSPPSSIERVAESLRRGLRTAAAGLPDDDRGLLPALVVADRSQVSQPVLDDFRRAGMDFLMAVGGLHFMVVCGVVLWLLRRFSVGPRTCAVIAGAVLAGYATVAGWQPNVLRAGLMVGIGLLAVATGRARSACAALAGTVIVLVLWQPGFAVDLGFALSVLATAAMVLLAKPTADALIRRGLPPGIAELAAVALVAQLATAPLIAAAYGQLSLPSVAANILVEPAFVPAMLFGVLAMACAPVWPWLAALIAHLAVPETSWLLAIAHHTARLPGTAITWPTGWWGGLGLAAVLAVIVIALRFRRLRILMAVAVVVVFLVVVPVRLIAPGWPPTGWAMIDCDVGQGDGEVLATDQPGRAVVVDTGPDEVAIDECLDRLDIDRIPLIVLSHLHADHVGGLAAVLRGRAVGAVAVGPSRVPAWAWTQVLSETATARVPVVELAVGQRLSWPGLTLDVLGPAPAESWPGGDDPSGTVVNNSSLVLRATTSAGRILLTGDVELAAQADLLESKEDLRADVLKIPHHGSRFSAPAFLDAVHARIAVASVGAGNPYGHPSPLTLDRLMADGALVLRTDHDGDVAIVRAPTGAPAVVRRGDPRPPPAHARHPALSGGG